MTIKKHIIYLLYVTTFVIIADQVSKFYIMDLLSSQSYIDAPQIYLLPFLNITLIWNYGISFGIFNDASQNQFLLIVTSLSIVSFLLFMYIKKKKLSLRFPIGMIIGGALGNCIDRFFHGAVVDFIDFHAFSYHYPSFNIADSAIVIGSLLLLLNKDF